MIGLSGMLACTKPVSPAGEPGHNGHAPGAVGEAAADRHMVPDDARSRPSLMVTTSPTVLQAGEPALLDLMVHDAAGAMVTDFETVHEKKLHLILVRAGLDEFAHVHPELHPGGTFTVAYTFPAAGLYRIYADHKVTGGEPSVAIAEVTVAGQVPPAPQLTANAPGRVSAGELSADIAIAKAPGNETTRISIALLDLAGRPVDDLQPYLGALGHLVVLSADGQQYIHAHPVALASEPGAVAFDAHFPGAGLYKGWGQFRRRDVLHTVSFVVPID